MVRCDICRLGQARFVCKECGRRLCNKCFDPSTDLCVVCKAPHIKIAKLPYVQRTRTSSLLGRMVPLGIALVFIGIVLMMVGVLMITEPGKGLVILFPFFIGSVESTTAILVLSLVLILMVLALFLPWILGPRRVWRILSRASALEEPVEAEKIEAAAREYYLTVDLGDVVRDTVNVRALKHRIQVQGRKKDGNLFIRNFEFPENVNVKIVEHEYGDNFLVIRVNVSSD